MAFYDIDKEYVKFLRTLDEQIPNIEYESHNKFVCGVVLEINGIKYYAPISHMKNKQQTNIQIKQGKKVLSTIRFCFMIPACDEVLTKKDFKKIAETDKSYADLLAAEYNFCRKNSDAIYEKAKKVYHIGCNKEHKLNYTCCDFKKLEEHYTEYNTKVLHISDKNNVKEENNEEQED